MGRAIWNLLEDDIIQLASQFSSVSFSFVRRQFNKVAHSKARWVLINSAEFMFLNDVPECALSFVIEDSSLVSS